MQKIPDAHQSLGMEQQTILEMRTSILGLQQTRYHAEIVDAFARKAHEAVLVLAGQSHHAEEMKSTQSQEALAYRFLSDALYRAGNESMKYMNECAMNESYNTVLAELDTIAQEAMELVVSGWRNRLCDMPRGLPVNFGKGQYIFQRRNQSEDGQVSADYMSELQSVAEIRYPSKTRDIYDRVRSAVFRRMQPDDVPQVVSLYKQALLTSETLEYLVRPESASLETINEQISQFRNKLQKGVFIWDMQEEELLKRLKTEEPLPLNGRVLASGDQILGWLTYKHMPGIGSGGSKKMREKIVKRYLNRGVTDAKVTYADPEMKERLLLEWPRVELFEDIRTKLPFVSSRLATLAFEEMLQMNSLLKFVIAYKLHDLYVEPQEDLLNAQSRDEGILPNENDKSYSKFRAWGFRHIAIDYNASPDAPKSPRSNVGGVDRLLNPKWEIICGALPEVIKQTRSEWRKIQTSHGDFSHDHAQLHMS